VNEPIPSCAADTCRRPDLCPLNCVQAGTAVRIKQLAATPEVTLRLREMGFCEEQQIKLLSRSTNVICQVCNARLGISQQLAETILVEPLPPRQLDLQVA
jgi:Fe2+ transport system protein FeoA